MFQEATRPTKILPLLALLLGVACSAANAQESNEPAPKPTRGHLLVHVVKVEDSFKIERATYVASELPKQRRANKIYPWRYTVRAFDGSVIFERGIADPTVLRGEFANADDPQKIDSVRLRKPGRVDFVIRLPLVDGKRIEFFSVKTEFIRSTIIPADGYQNLGSVPFPTSWDQR